MITKDNSPSCPRCGNIENISQSGDVFICNECGHKFTFNELGETEDASKEKD